MSTGHGISTPQDLTNGFGIYLHTPFCKHRCSYCDFYSLTESDSSDRFALAGALVRELEAAAVWLKETRGALKPVTSVFFGGGTPSLLPMEALARIFSAVLTAFPVAPDAEITLEANPETVNDRLCEGLKLHTPVNRISLGAQSFDTENLRKLERLGSAEIIESAAVCLGAHGYSNFNLDLIFGIPGQSLPQVLTDIRRAASLGPKHISFYNLTLKPGHALYGALPDDDFSADLYEAGVEALEICGYHRYEISNFALPDFHSRHNLLYWSGGDYLGVGPSAASRFFWDGAFHHRRQVADLERYVGAGSFPAPGLERISPAATILEATFLEMRREEGVDLEGFRARYGYDLSRAAKFGLFLDEGMISQAEGRLRLTRRGLLLADAVTRDLVDV